MRVVLQTCTVKVPASRSDVPVSRKALTLPRLTISILLLTLVATDCNKVSATEPKVADFSETKYLTFQLMTGLHGYAGPHPMPGHFALEQVRSWWSLFTTWSRLSERREMPGTNWASPWGPSVSTCPTRKLASSSAILLPLPGKTTWPLPFTLMIRFLGENVRISCPILITSRLRTGNKNSIRAAC